MPLTNHKSFGRPPVSIKLWRYTDIPKFVELLTSKCLWLTNLEILANDDPYEGIPGPVRFPHRMWNSIDQLPASLRHQIIEIYCRDKETKPEDAFKIWYMLQEQECIFNQFGRRQFYVSCWHAAAHESFAMWKIYASPGAGLSVVTNGARLEAALAKNAKDFHLGSVRYEDPNILQFGASNVFDTVLVKRESYSYENEIRLVYWDTNDMHDPLEKFIWNESTMRFDELVDDKRPLLPGVNLECDVDILVERVVISPFAPIWYESMISRLCDQLGFVFPVESSKLLTIPDYFP